MRKYPKQALIHRPVEIQAKSRFPVDRRGGGHRLILDYPSELLDEMSECFGIDVKITPICIDILESLCVHNKVTRPRQQPEQLIRSRLTRRDSHARRIRSIRNTGRPFDVSVEYARPLKSEGIRRMIERGEFRTKHCDRPTVLQRCADELRLLTRNILYDVTPAENVCEGLARSGWDSGRVLQLVEELQVLNWLTIAEKTEDELEDKNGFRYRKRAPAGWTGSEFSLVQPSSIIPGNQCIFCRGTLRNHNSIVDRAGKGCLRRWIEVYAVNLVATSPRPTPAAVLKEIREWWRNPNQVRIDEYGDSTHPVVKQIERLERLLKVDGPSYKCSNYRNKYAGWAGTPLHHMPIANLIYYAVTLQNKLLKTLKKETLDV